MSKTLNARLTKCALAAGAAVAIASAADAGIVYSGVVNTVIAPTIDGLYLNIESGASGSSGSSVAGWDVNPYGSYTAYVALYAATGTGYMRTGAGTSTNQTALAEGEEIGSAAYFYGSSRLYVGSGVGQVLANSTAIVGFRFNGADALTHYGWMRIAIGASATDRTLVDYAFDDVAGAAILAGATGVPAPGALALLGVAGLVSRRRR